MFDLPSQDAASIAREQEATNSIRDFWQNIENLWKQKQLPYSFDVTPNWTIAAPTVGQLEEMFNARH